MKESEIQKEIVSYCKKCNFLVFRMNVNNKSYNIKGLPEGTPDLLIITPAGNNMWVEIKNETGKLRPKQIEFHEKLRKYNQDVYVVRSLEEFIEILKEKY